MKKAWLVFKYEYLRHVLRKRFIFALLSFPMMFLFFIVILVVMLALQYNSHPLGYVDLSGLLTNPVAMPVEKDTLFPPVQIKRYETETLAKSALLAKQIQAYYVIGIDYQHNKTVRMYALDTPSEATQIQFTKFIRYNLLVGQPPQIVARVMQGPKMTIRASDGARHVSENQVMNILLPLAGGFLFFIAVTTSGGYLLQALVEEKENRTMEIIITSLSPGHLMTGKIAGNMCVGLTELLSWILFGLATLFIIVHFIAPDLTIHLDSSFVLLNLATFIPAFVMIAALMAAVGATATESREAQQVAGLFTIPIMIPFWLVTALIMNPNSPLSVGLSLFPLTAPISLPLRAAFTTVPAWQIGLSLTLLCSLAAVSIWFAGRAFRLGMLRYGKRLSWKELFSRTG
jgi:ABC-2 type transport system permease protein